MQTKIRDKQSDTVAETNKYKYRNKYKHLQTYVVRKKWESNNPFSTFFRAKSGKILKTVTHPPHSSSIAVTQSHPPFSSSRYRHPPVQTLLSLPPVHPLCIAYHGSENSVDNVEQTQTNTNTNTNTKSCIFVVLWKYIPGILLS